LSRAAWATCAARELDILGGGGAVGREELGRWKGLACVRYFLLQRRRRDLVVRCRRRFSPKKGLGARSATLVGQSGFPEPKSMRAGCDFVRRRGIWLWWVVGVGLQQWCPLSSLLVFDSIGGATATSGVVVSLALLWRRSTPRLWCFIRLLHGGGARRPGGALRHHGGATGHVGSLLRCCRMDRFYVVG
jgi:hypothetical protein